ncbi:MAG: tetratricopeptide repeat protein [Bacteroidetes bacterium]|nr:tetratricopeptide repeat protein [Bacteroidota bacterium]
MKILLNKSFLLVICFFCVTEASSSTINNTIDSLSQLIQIDKEDTNKVIHLIDLGVEFQRIGGYDSSLFYVNKALILATRLEYQKGMALSYHNIGNSYYYQGTYDKSLRNYLKALTIREKMGDKKGVASTHQNIGNIYLYQNNYNKALESYSFSLRIREKMGDNKGIADSYNNIGIIYEKQGDYKQALSSYLQSLKIVKEIGNKKGIAAALYNIGNIYYYQGNVEGALNNYLQSLKIEEEIGSKEGIAASYTNIGVFYGEQGKFEESYHFLNKSLILSTEIGDKRGVKVVYYALSDLYNRQKNYQQAYNYYKLYSDTKDSLINEESSKQIAEMATKYETDKKEAENQLLVKDNALKNANINNQQLIIYGISIVLLFALAMAFLIFIGYKRKKQTNFLLEIKNTAIELQKNIIEKKNTQITDSIDYAKNIQDAILPLTSDIKAAFSDAFILYQPKDIVSGDFYWFYTTKQHIYLSVIDCTGHGVPGAFMSLMAYNLLEKIVKQQNITTPSEILDNLNMAVLDILKQHHEESTAKFGMDMALVRIDKTTQQLVFSGAHNSLYIINNSQLTELKADTVSIGTKRQITSHFTNHTYQLIKNNQLYLFTDGYADQLGGENRKRFYSTRLKTLLTDISLLPMSEQKITLQHNFEIWKGTIEQLDDVCIIGVRI